MHIFGTNNLMDDATLSIVTGTENSQFPLSNLLVPITSKVFRSTGNSVSFMIDTGTITPIDTFMLCGDNKVGLGVQSVSIYGSTTNDFSTSTEIPVDISAEYNFGWVKFDSVNYRYWKVELTGATYCEISNLYLGESTQITTNAITLGSFKYANKENASIYSNKYGVKFVTTYNSQKILTGAINLLNTTELAVLREIANDHKRSKPIWFVTDSENTLHADSEFIYSGFFYFEKDMEFVNTHSGLWSTSIALEEVA